MSYLGLDIGTTGCKAAIFDGQGAFQALAYREYPLITPRAGWAELDSALVCHACLEVLQEVTTAVPADPVRALAISCQGEAFTPLDAQGRFLARAMVSSDARAAELARQWSAQFGRYRLYELTGHTPHPMFTLFKLLWLREQAPDIWSQVHRFYCFEELLQRQLGLEPAISWPLAGRTMLFNVRTHRWEEEILAAAGLEASQLAKPVPSGTVVGQIPPAIAGPLGLPEGVLVVAGGHDQTCGALGAGVVQPGVAMYATGTVECICPCFPQPIFEEQLFRHNLCTYDYTIPGMATTVAFSLTGGNLLRWFRDQWGAWETQEALRCGKDVYEVLLASLPTEPSNLLVLPYFTPSGTPYFDAETPGAILGLRLSTTRAEVLRGLLEGVALEMRLNVELLEAAGLAIREFRAIGGGAKSPRLTQLKADVLNRPITTLTVTEAGCLGAAMLACSAHTGASLGELVSHWIQPTNVVVPNPERAAVYRDRFSAYKDLYPRIRAWGATFS